MVRKSSHRQFLCITSPPQYSPQRPKSRNRRTSNSIQTIYKGLHSPRNSSPPLYWEQEIDGQLRGLALTNFSFLRNLHNSLSRSSERADLDIALMEAANAKRGTKSAGWEADEMFHFIAYVPVNGVLWELDGLRRQPVRLGLYYCISS